MISVSEPVLNQPFTKYLLIRYIKKKNIQTNGAEQCGQGGRKRQEAFADYVIELFTNIHRVSPEQSMQLRSTIVAMETSVDTSEMMTHEHYMSDSFQVSILPCCSCRFISLLFCCWYVTPDRWTVLRSQRIPDLVYQWFSNHFVNTISSPSLVYMTLGV